MCVPFHIVNIFDEIDGQVDVFNELFLDTLSEHAPIKRIKIKSRPNPFITPEIKQLMKTRDSWQKRRVKQTTNSTGALFNLLGKKLTERWESQKRNQPTKIHHSLLSKILWSKRTDLTISTFR